MLPSEIHDALLVVTALFFALVFLFAWGYDDDSEGKVKREIYDIDEANRIRALAVTDERVVEEREAERRWLQHKREHELDAVIARVTGIHRDSKATRSGVATRKQFETDKGAS